MSSRAGFRVADRFLPIRLGIHLQRLKVAGTRHEAGSSSIVIEYSVRSLAIQGWGWLSNERNDQDVIVDCYLGLEVFNWFVWGA